MDGARLGGGRQDRRPAQIEHQDYIAGAVHPHDAAARERAFQGGGETRNGQLSSPRARRRSLSIARAPRRVNALAQPVVGDRLGDRGGALARGFARGRRGAAGLARCGERPLAQRDPADAAPAQMGVDPRDDDRRGVLRLQREGRVDAQNQGRWAPARRGLLGAARRPLDLRRLGVARDARRRRSPASRRSGSSGRGRARRASARRWRRAANRPAPRGRASCRWTVSSSRRRR